MEIEQAIERLSQEWELETGFFGRLRYGTFDQEGADRVIQALQDVAPAAEVASALDRRFVSLIWFIPLFMSWQREQVKVTGGDVQELNNTIDAIEAWLQKILGVP